LKEISKELVDYIRKHSPSTHIHPTVNKHYVEETRMAKKLIAQYEKNRVVKG